MSHMRLGQTVRVKMLRNKMFWILLLMINISSATLCAWLGNVEGVVLASVGAMCSYYMAAYHSNTDDNSDV